MNSLGRAKIFYFVAVVGDILGKKFYLPDSLLFWDARFLFRVKVSPVFSPTESFSIISAKIKCYVISIESITRVEFCVSKEATEQVR